MIQMKSYFHYPSSIIHIRKNNYPLSNRYYEEYVRRLNSKNITIQNAGILGLPLNDFNQSDFNPFNPLDLEHKNETYYKINGTRWYGISRNPYKYRQGQQQPQPIRSLISKASRLYNQMIINLEQQLEQEQNGEIPNFESPNERDKTSQDHDSDDADHDKRFYTKNPYYYGQRTSRDDDENDRDEKLTSKNFRVIKKYPITFSNIGGYEKVKQELDQCVDMLKNYKKYGRYNVRIPKGLIFEGPPGNGKTLLAKGLAGEAGCGFIAVSGADFQEKYVGVGSSRIKEMFDLAKKNVPCIIFIDEIDAVGRKRSNDGETSSSERDNTLNALLVEMDGFKNNTGVFIVGATNRMDLLDSALTRPGRIDKKIYIGFPDSVTREAIINIHIRGKPYDHTVVLKDLVEITEGLSGAQIENLLNEAMLNALKNNGTYFTYKDFDVILNKMMAGWQPVEHDFSKDVINRIAIHEMGHAIVGILSKHHSKMSKVIINLSSPKTPGYTVFETSTSNIYKREALFEHLMILLAGRIAEEVFYDVSVTTGAINDFEEALKLAEKMVVYYGMGKNIIYPSLSEKYKEMIDDDVVELINDAYKYSQIIISEAKELILETSEMLKRDKLLKANTIINLIHDKYLHLLELKIFE